MALSIEGIKFITEETLDVDLCTTLDGENENTSGEQAFQWRPLSPEKLTEVMKEANMLASQLERCQLREKTTGNCSVVGLQAVPKWEPLPLTRLLREEKTRKTRRRTFDVKNSEMKALLPTVGPETCSAQNSPKAPSPKQGGRASSSVDLPGAKKLQNKPKISSVADQLLKKYGLRQSLRASTLMKSSAKKPQATSKVSRKERSPPFSGPDNPQHQQSPENLEPVPRTNRKTVGTTIKDAPCKEPQPQATSRISRKKTSPPLSGPDNPQHQQSPENLKPVPRTNRKTVGTTIRDAPCKEPQPQATSRISRKKRSSPLSGPDNPQHQQSPEHMKPVPRTNRKTVGTTVKDAPCKEPQLSHKDSSRRGTTTVARMKGKPDPKLCPPETRAFKRSLAAPKKSMDLQKSSANQSKTTEGDEPQLQAASKPHEGSYHIRSSHSTTSPLASRIPVPKTANCTKTSDRCPQTTSKKPSQLQALNVGLPRGKGSPMSSSASKKVNCCPSLHI